VPGKAPHLSRPYRQYDAEIPPPVGIEKDQHSGATPDGEAVPEGELGRPEGAEARYCGLGAH
jgi:hypothetical protein